MSIRVLNQELWVFYVFAKFQIENISSPPPQPHPRGYCENKGWRGYSSGSVYTVYSIFAIFSFFTLFRLEGLLEELTSYFLCFNLSWGRGSSVYCHFLWILTIFTVFTHWLGMGRFRLTCCFQCFHSGSGGGVDHTQNHAVFTHELSRQRMQQHIFTTFWYYCYSDLQFFS